MKTDIVEKKDNPFLKRTDVLLRVDHAGQATPKKEELIKVIADTFKSVPENVEIDYIFSEVGSAKSKVKAKVWKEKPPEKKKKKPEKVEEKPREEEKPEKKEEKPKEVKPEGKKEGEKSEA